MASSYGPGETVTIQSITQSAPGWTPTNADTLPTAVLVRNGADTAETVTVVNVGTGIYTLSWTIPVSWDIGDTVEVRMSATVGSVDGSAIVWSERLGYDVVQGPLAATTVSDVLGPAPIKLVTFEKSRKIFSLALIDVNGDAVDASGMTLRFTVENRAEPSVELFTVSAVGITVSGVGNNIVNVTVGVTDTTQTPGSYNWRLWDDSVSQVLLFGEFIILSTSE